MKTIRITDGITYGYRQGDFISPKTKADGAFEVTDEEAERLIISGHAVLVGEVEDIIILPPDSDPENSENDFGEGVNPSEEENAEIGETSADNSNDEEPETYDELADDKAFLSTFTVSTLKGIAEDLKVYSSELRNKAEIISALLPLGLELPFTEEVLSKMSNDTLKDICENIKVYTSDMRSKDSKITAILDFYASIDDNDTGEDFIV